MDDLWKWLAVITFMGVVVIALFLGFSSSKRSNPTTLTPAQIEFLLKDPSFTERLDALLQNKIASLNAFTDSKTLQDSINSLLSQMAEFRVEMAKFRADQAFIIEEQDILFGDIYRPIMDGSLRDTLPPSQRLPSNLSPDSSDLKEDNTTGP